MPRNPESPSGPRAEGHTATADPAIAEAAAAWFALRDAGLTPVQAEALQRWRAADPRHEAALAQLDSAWSTFGKASRTGQVDALLEELAHRATRRRRQRFFAAAASLAVLLLGAALWRLPPSGASGAPPPRTATMLAPVKRSLPDGSMVILKDGAQIAVAFTAMRRHVQLQQGQAMFEVARDPARPFVVSAGGVEIQAVGTAFSIQLGRQEVEILVTAGTVAIAHAEAPPTQNPEPAKVSEERDAGRVVQHPPPSGSAQPPAPAGLRVSAGNRVVVGIAPASAQPPQVQPFSPAVLDEWLAWRHLRVEFSGTPLAEAVALLNREAARHSGLQLRLDDPTLGAMRVSGVFRVDNTEAFVLLLEAGFGVEAQRAGNTIRLRKAPASTAR